MNVTVKKNDEHKGLEISFDKKPDRDVLDQLKAHGFRWHNARKVWFAKETAEREVFANKLEQAGTQKELSNKALSKPVSEERKESAAEKTAPEGKKANTFAAHYDSIGDAKIIDNSDVGFLTYTEAYIKDINCNFRRSYSGDHIVLTDLTNAGKTGKTCQSWSLYPQSYNDNVVSQLSKEENISTCKELFDALREGRELDSVRLNVREEKGVDVFSPFVEVKPLKAIPEKWTKRNFTQALLSGQVYRGEVSYRYTDDYAMDSAYKFGEGVCLHMPSFAKRVLEDWSSLTSVYSSSKKDAGDDKNVCISYSEHSNSGKTLWFDLDCDIAEGKRREEERQAGLVRFNQMMKASCITLKAEQIDPAKVYSIQQLDMNANTDRYEVSKENIPGYVLRARVEEGLIWDVLSAKAMDIQPDHLYEVSNFFHRPTQEIMSDQRVIECGNYQCIVFGKALQELIAEQVHLPVVSRSDREYGPTFERAEATLQQFVNGQSRFFGNNATDYGESLNRLHSEYARANGRNQSLDQIIGSAAQRSTAGKSAEQGKVLPFQR